MLILVYLCKVRFDLIKVKLRRGLVMVWLGLDWIRLYLVRLGCRSASIFHESTGDR